MVTLHRGSMTHHQPFPFPYFFTNTHRTVMCQDAAQRMKEKRLDTLIPTQKRQKTNQPHQEVRTHPTMSPTIIKPSNPKKVRQNRTKEHRERERERERERDKRARLSCPTRRCLTTPSEYEYVFLSWPSPEITPSPTPTNNYTIRG